MTQRSTHQRGLLAGLLTLTIAASAAVAIAAEGAPAPSGAPVTTVLSPAGTAVVGGNGPIDAVADGGGRFDAPDAFVDDHRGRGRGGGGGGR